MEMMMSAGTQGIEMKFEKDLSTVLIGDATVEIGDNGHKVTAYGNAGVEIKSAAAETAAKSTQFSVSEDFRTVVVNGVTIQKAADGHLVISTSGTVITKPESANDSTARSSSEIGAIEKSGDHKGEIYGGIYPADQKPIWFSAAPKLMDHYAAAAWANERGGALPTRKQGDYLDSIKDQGAFKTLFNRSGSFPAGYVWLAEPLTTSRNFAWCQRLSDGVQYFYYRNDELPVLCVRR
jgi:hypothetical protein